MIARIWRGETRAEDADAYLAYLHRTGLPAYAATPGNRGVRVLRRLRDGRAEFVLVTFWETADAVRAFAGPDIDTPVYYPDDDAWLLGRAPAVAHFEVAWSHDGGEDRPAEGDDGAVPAADDQAVSR
jgi:hypothetical protein